MKVYLVKTSNVSTEVFNSILQFLNRDSKTIEFLKPEITLDFEKDLNYKTRYCSKYDFEHKAQIAPIYIRSLIKRLERDDAATLFENTLLFDILFHRFKIGFDPQRAYDKIQDYKKYYNTVWGKVESESIIQKQYKFPLEQHYIDNYTVFETCKTIRKYLNVAENDFIIFLSKYSQQHNWFYTLDPFNKNNAFVCTNDWNYFGYEDASYPVAHCIASALMGKQMFTTYIDWYLHQHPNNAGCIMDFCRNKKNIHNKIRSASICESYEQFIPKEVPAAIRHLEMMKVLENVRTYALRRQKQKTINTPYILSVEEKGKLLHFKALEKTIQLNPLEATVYRLYLNHKEGLTSKEFRNSGEEFANIYEDISPQKSKEYIDETTETFTRYNANRPAELRSRINSLIRSVLPECIAKNYVIDGERGCAKRILIDRDYVHFPPNLQGGKERGENNSRLK